MDSRAKQRLTGAVILVALFVLLVPELLRGPRDGKPPPESAAEDGLRRYTIDLDNPQSSVSSAQSAPPPQVALPEVATNPMSEGTQAVPGESAQPERQPESATEPAPKPQTSASTQAVVVAATPASAAAPPRTENAQPVAPAATNRAGSFAVQLGSFVSRDNADRLVREMTSKGFSAFVAPITSGGRELYRVRVGPTRDRASAEALAAQLRRIGQPGSIVSIS